MATNAGNGMNQRLLLCIFVGQSSTKGGHSNAIDIVRFPPFSGLENRTELES